MFKVAFRKPATLASGLSPAEALPDSAVYVSFSQSLKYLEMKTEVYHSESEFFFYQK